MENKKENLLNIMKGTPCSRSQDENETPRFIAPCFLVAKKRK